MLILIILSGCTTDNSKNGNSITSFGNVHIVNHGLINSSIGKIAVKGLAKNIGEKELSLVQIKVNFYDVNDTLIDTSLDIASNVDPEEVWIFEIHCHEDDIMVDDYTIGVGKVWYS